MSFYTPFLLWMGLTAGYLLISKFRLHVVSKPIARLISGMFIMGFGVMFLRFAVAYAQAASRDFSQTSESAAVAKIAFEGQGSLMSLIMVTGTMLAIVYCEYRLRKLSST